MELRCSLALYVIPDRKMGRGRDLLTQAQLALAGGATAIQLRDKELPGRDLYELAVKMKALCSKYGALFIVNDRLDVALAANCDGVHLGQETCRYQQPDGSPLGFIEASHTRQKRRSGPKGMGPIISA